MCGGIVTTKTSESSGGAVEGESIDVVLVRRIARTLDEDPTDLPPLAWQVDLDALKTLLADSRVSVSFEYEGCDVRIDEDGDVTVTRREDTER